MHEKISFANNFGIWIRIMHKEEGRRIDYSPKVNILTKGKILFSLVSALD